MAQDYDESTVMIPTFSPGSFFADRYKIIGLIGTGAMGRVYEAEELHGGRRVALKVLHAERIAEPEIVSRFQREAEVLASIGHPSIVEVYAFHKSIEEIPYLAMELLEGVTLKKRLHSGGRFEDPLDLQEIVDALAGALEVAHRVGVTHRDIKPDNVFLPSTGNPRAKLVDFGLSRVAKQDASLTQNGAIIGTPRYMAPEQMRDPANTGPLADIYSLGVVIYECLTGSSPYPAQDYGQLLGCLLEGRTIPFAQARSDLHRLDAFMSKALAQDPARRFQSAGDLADAYALTVGRPSRRAELAAAARPVRKTQSGQSHAKVAVRSLSSTLAWDASAARNALAVLEAGPPPGMVVDPEAIEAQAEMTNSAVGIAPTLTKPIRAPVVDEVTDVLEQPRPAAHPPSPAHAPPTGMTPPPYTPPPYTPAPLTPAPMAAAGAPLSQPPPPGPASYTTPSHAGYAQGGDTLFLADGQHGPMFPPEAVAPARPPEPSAPVYSPSAAVHGVAPLTPAPAKKKRSYGVVIFLVALLLVVVLSALGGLALRSYMRGRSEPAAAPVPMPLEG